jgi:hypothetical protein
MTPELDALHAHLTAVKAGASPFDWTTIVGVLGPVAVQAAQALGPVLLQAITELLMQPTAPTTTIPSKP